MAHGRSTVKTQLPFDAEIISSPLQSSFTFPFHLPSGPSSEISRRTKKTQLGIGKRTGKCLNYCTTGWIIFMKRISHVAHGLRTGTTGSSEKKSSLRVVQVERNSTLNPLASYSSYLAASFVIPSNVRFRAKSVSEIARFLPRNLNICARERHSEGWFTCVRNTLCCRKWFSRRFDVRDSGEYFRTATRRPTRACSGRF